ncbi:peritrophin-1-like isoform X1 [Zophobas morio]|uniref:peritrophin-1-like isoform X1 n=1 Tax=Zophobas morio TaxID=2755281 RepID=UPI003082E1A6
MNKFIGLITICAALIAGGSAQTDPSDACHGLDPTQTIFLPVAGDCSKYIQCFNEVGTLFECSEGLWWHPEISDCDYPGSYCIGTNGSTTRRPSPGPDPRCVDGNTAYFPHPAYCNRYIECMNGFSYEMECPTGLYWSDIKKECVNANQSECCNHSSTC